MKKVLIVFDGSHFSEGVFDFVIKQNASNPLLLTCVFLSSIDYSTMLGYPIVAEGYLRTINDDVAAISKNADRVRILCEKNGIEYRLHDDVGGDALMLLQKETRFADLLIISGELFYRGMNDKQPVAYMQHILHKAECPVLVLPEKYEYPTNIILGYDGSHASVYAIKQFIYLFPEWCKCNAYLIYANEKDNDIPDKDYITELAARHFPNLILHKLDMDASKYFDTWITDIKSPILVTGAFARSGISELMRKSFVSEVIRDHKVPVFVAHR